MAERESELFFAPFARSSATPCRLFRVHRDRATRISVSRPSKPTAASAAPPVLPPCAHPSQRAPRATLSRVSIRARYARTSGTFRFLPSPLHPYAVNRLYDSRFGVKVFPKMLHRGEASALPPPSDCNRPPNDRSTRTHPGGENHEKLPAKCRKAGAIAPRSPTVAVKAWVKGFSAKPSPLTV